MAAPVPYMIVPPTGADQSDEWVKLGVKAQTSNALPEAQSHLENALRIRPDNHIATLNLAICHAQSSRINEALLTVERACILNPKHAFTWMNRAIMCMEADRIDEAIECAELSVSLEENEHTLLPLAMLYPMAGMPERSIPLYEKILKLNPKHFHAAPNLCFTQTLAPVGPEALAASRKAWYEIYKYRGVKQAHRVDTVPGRKLRIGYLSGDFKTHSAAMIFGNVIAEHDLEKFEVFLYSTLLVEADKDLKTKFFMDLAKDHFRPVFDKNPDELEAIIRGDQIDILVDLAGHTHGGRLETFTRKAAPIQVTAWGFAHGTGVPEIDYFFADPVSVPENEREHFVEKIWDLPSIITYQAPHEYKTAPDGNSPLPFYFNEYITFGVFSRYEKLSDFTISTFYEILKQVPTSRIYFKDHGFRRPYSLKRVMALMKDIDPARFLFGISTSHYDHMLTYQKADIGLDMFPHGGGVVSLEQLYMGLPLVTLYGTQPAGRSAASVLTAMGHEELIARSADEYIKLAVDLAADPVQLVKYRKTLRHDLLESPVIKGYTKNVEDAYTQMFEKLVSSK